MAKGALRSRAGASVHENDLQSPRSPALAPCVVYECTNSFEITYVSPNTIELINVSEARLIGTRAFSQERVFSLDVDLLTEQLSDLQSYGFVSFLHRLVDDCGLPVWVAHSLRTVGTGQDGFLSGCLIPIRGDTRFLEHDHSALSRFIHKIGNHFQLITLLMNPIKRTVPPDCKETEILEQTVEKSIDLTRAFSEYSQWPSGRSEIEVWDFLNAVIPSRVSLFSEAGISLEVSIEDALRGVLIMGDAGLLESAISNVLQNALESTQSQGRVSVKAKLEKSLANSARVLTIRFADSGCGIKCQDMDKVGMAFYSTRKDRNGLGLSMATRFVGLHGGSCRIDSWEGKGTEVTMSLPVNSPFQGFVDKA